MGRSFMKFGILAMLLLLCAACGASKGNQNTRQTGQPQVQQTQKKGNNQLIITTGTPDISAATPTIAGFLPPLVDENCIPVSDASGKVGQTVCLKGTISKARQSDYGYIINFDDQPDSFVLVIPDAFTASQKAGQCILVKGKVVLAAGRPQITLSKTDQLQFCR
jgi:hypothetical protein